MDLLMPVIFPERMVHAEVAQYIIHMNRMTEKATVRPDSAGFVSLTDCKCHGESESLGIKSKPERDSAVLLRSDYGGNWVEKESACVLQKPVQ